MLSPGIQQLSYNFSLKIFALSPNRYFCFLFCLRIVTFLSIACCGRRYFVDGRIVAISIYTSPPSASPFHTFTVATMPYTQTSNIRPLNTPCIRRSETSFTNRRRDFRMSSLGNFRGTSLFYSSCCRLFRIIFF